MQVNAIDLMVNLTGSDQAHFTFVGTDTKIPCVLGDLVVDRFNADGGEIGNADMLLQVKKSVFGPLSSEDITNWKTEPEWISSLDIPLPRSGMNILIREVEYKIIDVAPDSTNHFYEILIRDRYNRGRD